MLICTKHENMLNFLFLYNIYVQPLRENNVIDLILQKHVDMVKCVKFLKHNVIYYPLSY